jgi:hypothetical protein
MNKCQECGSTNIKYYRQMRKDHVWVVTARCENWHHPIKGKPFYPVSDFVLRDLPDLKNAEIEPRQLTMLEQIQEDARIQYPPVKEKVPYKNFPLPVGDHE